MNSGDDNAALAIDARGLTRRFGDRTAVEGLNLKIAQGAVVGLLGPNGAGKTTTLSLLTGLLPADEGEVRLLGKQVTPDRLEHRGSFGLVGERLALFPGLSLGDNIVFAGRLHGLDEVEAEGRTADLAGFLDLAAAIDLTSSEASFGQRKRAALAMALVHAPPLLLLDEPFTGLDPLGALRVRELLESLKAKGTTILLASHVLEIVERLCDRAVVISEGRKVLDESVSALTEDADLAERFSELFGRADQDPLPWLL